MREIIDETDISDATMGKRDMGQACPSMGACSRKLLTRLTTR